MAVKVQTDEEQKELNFPLLMTCGDGGMIMLAVEEDGEFVLGTCLRGSNPARQFGQSVGVNRATLTPFIGSVTLTNE